jgi:predicted metal-dependent hydrolase
VGRIERFVEARLRELRKHGTPAANLAHTVALEHITALFVTAVLGRMFGRRGVLRRVGPLYRAYFERSFHPTSTTTARRSSGRAGSYLPDAA